MHWLRRQHVVSRLLQSVTHLLLLHRGKAWGTRGRLSCISNQGKKYSTAPKLVHNCSILYTSHVSAIKFYCSSAFGKSQTSCLQGWNLNLKWKKLHGLSQRPDLNPLRSWESFKHLDIFGWSTADAPLNMEWLWRVQWVAGDAQSSWVIQCLGYNWSEGWVCR